MLLLICVIGALVAASVAMGKNRNPLGWGALGFFLPLIGVVAVLCLPADGDTPQPS